MIAVAKAMLFGLLKAGTKQWKAPIARVSRFRWSCNQELPTQFDN